MREKLQLVAGARLVRGQGPCRRVKVEVVILLLGGARNAERQHELALLAGVAEQPWRQHVRRGLLRVLGGFLAGPARTPARASSRSGQRDASFE
jgi:hypothetical protein